MNGLWKKERLEMLVTFQQKQSTKGRSFEIKKDENVFLKVHTPWENPIEFHQIEDVRNFLFLDKNGHPLFHTDCRLVLNEDGAPLSLRDINTIGPRFYQLTIYGKKGSEGSFYVEPSGNFPKQVHFQSHNRIFSGKTFKYEQIQGIKFYEDEVQVAQLSRPLRLRHHLSRYYLHIEKENEDLLPIFIFFTLYCDSRLFHNGRSTLLFPSQSEDFSVNKDWVQTTFGTEAATFFRKEIDSQNPRHVGDKKKREIVSVILLSMLPFLVALLILIGGIIPNESNIMKQEEFTEEMKTRDFSLKKEGNRPFFDQANSAQIAKDSVSCIEFYTFQENEEANNTFRQTKELLKEKGPNLFDQNGFSLKEYTFYSQRQEGNFTFIARLGHTILFYQVPESEEKAARKVIKELGYL